ncbi:MAG: NTP transferase domain-containing protein [Nitrosopumilaceae archaeon]|nr:NTP transferase domain-containing protein [Nitrosopumilaceae archaeon]
MGGMIGLMMAGGRGSRMRPFPEKLTLGGHIPVALRVAGALCSCPAVSRTVAAVSPRAPRARAMLERRVDTLETPGDGYSADLAYALGRLEGAVLVVPADLPLLDGDILERVSGMHEKGSWTTVLVSEGYAARLGLSPGVSIRLDGAPYRYTGISAVDAGLPDSPPRYVTINDYRLAANMNTIRDWALLGAAHDLPEDYGL